MLTLKDCTKVQSKIRIVYPCLSSLISLAARKSLRNPTLMKFSCRGQRKLHLTPQNADSLWRAKTELRACSVSASHATRRRISILSACCLLFFYPRRCTNEAVEWILSRDIKTRAAVKNLWMKFKKIFFRNAKLLPKEKVELIVI